MRNVAAILNRETPATEDQHQDQSIPIEKIQLPAKQPRRFFDSDKLAQLVQSVAEHGILEPLLVRPLEGGGYELVAGERRLRAAREVGLEEVPIVVRELDDRQAIQVALIENLQREDLNPVEETDAVLDLLAIALETTRENVTSLFYQAHRAKHRGQELGQNVLSQLEIVQTVMAGVGRFSIDSFRSSRLPLLKLPEDVLDVLRQGKLEYTKAQTIARVKDETQRSKLLKQTIAKNLSLNEIKAAIKELKPEVEPTPEKVLVEQLGEIGKRLQKSETWGDRKRKERITKLLDELYKLTSDN
ncbi:MAG: ParB/RepB/Spo0J family partition protein [Oscillatoriophycideae cyanobacterium NC_groundwater_1537_Pr4_S-0.65um_50_18]|nr:ParB/RepB/Spo0J family partition protein [Oscillatoriophycideae cyanobacterium NC_groundwater_1537_Pr4_S-0.65um_50_18]